MSRIPYRINVTGEPSRRLLNTLLRILRRVVLGMVGLAIAAAATGLIVMWWHMRPQTFDPGDSTFAKVALQPLRDFVGEPLPGGIVITRYFRKNNFNDGSECWLLELETPVVLPEMVARLNLKRADPNHLALPNVDHTPSWVDRPRVEMKWFYIDDEARHRDRNFRQVAHPPHYLWSLDGKRFFLYHIIT